MFYILKDEKGNYVVKIHVQVTNGKQKYFELHV